MAASAFLNTPIRTNQEAAADITAEQLERFWLRVDKSGPIPAQRPELGPCWIWTRCLNSDGYGNVRLSGRQCRTHIVAWELSHGPVPEGLELDHLCRVRCCLNPAHLEPVTRAENHRRGLGSKVGCKVAGALQRAKTHCPKGHPYGGENLYVEPGGRRHCRVCQRGSHRRYMSKRRMREKTCPPVRPS